MILLVPARLAALAFAFWKRSLFYGLAVVNAIMLTETTWSFYYGGGRGEPCYHPRSWAYQSATR